MKKRFIPLLLALGLCRLGHAQTYLPDTIRVNRLTTTYLIFPGKVAMVDISPEYLVKIESGNIVFVRPRLTSARKTPFFVRTETGTYLGYLSLSGGKTPPAFVEVSRLLNPPPKPVVASAPPSIATSAVAVSTSVRIPFAATTSDNVYGGGPLLASASPQAGMSLAENSQQQPVLPVGNTKSALALRADSLLSGPATHHDREQNSGISVKLTHLVHDSENTYLQLLLANKTAMPFLLDQVSFYYQHQAKQRKGAYLDRETYPMEPVFQAIPERIDGGQHVQLRFALPQFAPQSGSRFVINVREKTGTRNVTLSLPMREILYARPRHRLLRGRFFETPSLLAFLRHEPTRK